MPKKRRMGIMIGSESDLPQCIDGLKYMIKKRDEGEIYDYDLKVNSIHRNPLETIFNLLKIARLFPDQSIDALIVGAGWANHLTGTADAFLRNLLHNYDVRVIGVAFEDKKDAEHTITAKNSILHVPGTQVIFQNEKGEQFIGRKGFLLACQYAVESELPIISPKQVKPDLSYNWDAALQMAIRLDFEQQVK